MGQKDTYFGDECDSNIAQMHEEAKAAAACPVDREGKACAGHGACFEGQCDCEDGWFGPKCAQPHVAGECPNKCSGRGVCGVEGKMAGKCLCQSGWRGLDCSKRGRHELALEQAKK